MQPPFGATILLRKCYYDRKKERLQHYAYDMSTEIVILDLLKKLSNDHSQLTWKINCVYVNGKDQSIYEIIIYTLPDQEIKGRITFNMLTGEVTNCYYQGVGRIEEEQIVDVLLDLINYETTYMLKMA